MHRLTILIGLLLTCVTASASPIGPKTAQQAGMNFLQRKGIIASDNQLTLYKTVGFADEGDQTTNCYYVFNNGNEGFVIVSADDRCTPIIGYSMNGSYDECRLPTNMAAWMEGCAKEIEAGIRDHAPENLTFKKLWNELLSAAPTTLSPKSDTFLLTSTWEQGYGYNEYCPVMDGYHVVVGCVATAMAQIIRYYQYPTRGFGQKMYVHEAYGQLGVDFDTTDYDYSLMPDELWYGSDDDEIDMVSRLCYHCGVVVNMTYRFSGHTSGSGAQTDRLPEGFRHFGYTDVEYYERATMNNDTRWVELIRNEIDNLRPIEYSGSNDDGGHAFVLDGYNNDNQYHFNWGWGGYCDGFYTLTTMCGYTSNHTMNINIKPSGWDGHLERFYVSTDGEGDGTSWEEANKNLGAAIKLNSLVDRDIWIKEGIYSGDTTADYALNITNRVNIVGGFAGTETAANQRNAQLHPVIIDGRGERGLLKARLFNNSNKTIKITDLTLMNGHRVNGSCVDMAGSVTGNYLIIRNNWSDTGSIVSLDECKMRMSIIEDNEAPTICQLTDATLRQSRVNNNDAERVMDLNGQSRVVNSDIVCNTGVGVVFNYRRNTFVNNIVWDNDTTMRIAVELLDTAIRNCAFESDTDFADSTWVRLGSDNNEGPKFIDPGHRGRAGLGSHDDYRLQAGSVCINAGERLTESIQDGDLDRSIRCRGGFIDLGCYESNYPVDIDEVGLTAIRIYPNPTSTTVTIDGCQNGMVELYDITGRLLLQQKCQDSATLDLSELPQGVYFLKNGGSSHKVIKQ